MEKFPTGDNPENINQEPAADENAEKKPLPYEEEMDKRQHYEQLFKEMKQNGALPEGVTDSYELREYTEEKQAHEAEQSKVDAEFIKHSNRYIAEISKIKNPQDKYIAIASLRYMTDVETNKSRQSDTENAQDVMLEFFNRDDKGETIKSFITNKVNGLMESGASEEEIKHSNLRTEYTDYMELVEECAGIQVINDNDNEDVEETLENRLKEKNLGDLDDFNFRSFGRTYTKFLEIDDPFTIEPNDFIERPESDRGIIVSMAQDLIDQIPNDDSNIMKQRYYKNKLTVLGRLYNGKNFDTQLQQIKDHLIRSVAEDIYDGKEQTNIDGVIRTTAILEMASKFNGRKKQYGIFLKLLNRGQQILDNFKNNSEA